MPGAAVPRVRARTNAILVAGAPAAAVERSNQQALARGHTTTDPAHPLLAVLDADGVARRVLREADLIAPGNLD
jgi:hypothetical protein